MAGCWFLSALFLLASAVAQAALVSDVRQAIGRDDFATAERLIQHYRSANGITPELMEAYSWLGRGALAGKRYDAAEKYAAETARMAVAELRKRKLDADRELPAALGAAIEVTAQVMAARGERDQAVRYLQEQIQSYRNTSIATRIQKNINLLGLEGKRAPALQKLDPGLMTGKPVLLFFWAHWCSDCKGMAPVLARIRQEFGPKGLAVIAPTQLYGYAGGGREVGPEEERRFIGRVRSEFYPDLAGSPMPVSAENFLKYGCSTTPTLVLVDRAGIVRMYHPGGMPYEELAARVREVVNGRSASPRTGYHDRPSPGRLSSARPR